MPKRLDPLSLLIKHYQYQLANELAKPAAWRMVIPGAAYTARGLSRAELRGFNECQDEATIAAPADSPGCMDVELVGRLVGLIRKAVKERRELRRLNRARRRQLRLWN